MGGFRIFGGVGLNRKSADLAVFGHSGRGHRSTNVFACMPVTTNLEVGLTSLSFSSESTNVGYNYRNRASAKGGLAPQSTSLLFSRQQLLCLISNFGPPNKRLAP